MTTVVSQERRQVRCLSCGNKCLKRCVMAVRCVNHRHIVTSCQPTMRLIAMLSTHGRHVTRAVEHLRFPFCQNGVQAALLGPAGTHVRNAATVGGNLALAVRRGLESDLVTVLIGARAQVQVANADGSRWMINN